MSLPALNELDALLLDLDDTILDDRGGLLAARDATVEFVVLARDDLSQPAFAASVEHANGWFWSDPERERRGRLDLEAARREIFTRALARHAIVDPRLVERAVLHYADAREKTFRMAPGADEALARLRERFGKLALVTNGAAVSQRAKIEQFSLADVFDHIQVEGEFGAGKPDARVYLHVCDRLGVAPERSLMVGDNHRCDVLGALQAGLNACWIDLAGRGAPPLPPPRRHASVRSLRELAERLGC